MIMKIMTSLDSETGIVTCKREIIRVQAMYNILMDKIMKQITSIELLALNGGAAGYDCMTLLQYEANTHRNSGDEELENAFWDEWADRFEMCVGIIE